MDGNARWARKRGLPIAAGHRAGTKALRRTVEAAIDLGVDSLAVYAFSTENWTRPPEEVELLMEIFTETIERELPDLVRQGVRTRFIGRRDRAPDALRERMAALEHETSHEPRLNLWIAFDYGGRAEIVDAANRAVAEGRRGRRGDVRLVPERAGHARSRSADPHLRRAEDLELPPVAARLRRARSSSTRSGRTSAKSSCVPPSTTTPAAGAASAAGERIDPGARLARARHGHRPARSCSALVYARRLVALRARGARRVLALHEYALHDRSLRPVMLAAYAGAMLSLARRRAGGIDWTSPAS